MPSLGKNKLAPTLLQPRRETRSVSSFSVRQAPVRADSRAHSPPGRRAQHWHKERMMAAPGPQCGI